MKKIILTLIVCVAFIAPSAAFAQCDNDDFMDECAVLLEDYMYVKSFDINTKSAKSKNAAITQYSYVFSKGTNYVITVCDQNKPGNKMVVSLYDRNKKLVATNVDPKTRKQYNKIIYPCQATGVYYLKYTWQANKVGCGVSILGFKK